MDKLNWIIEYNKNNNNEYSNFVVSGKYLAVYKPSHYMARKDGFVYIHQLQAEKKLGRNLNKNECVHHIDKNKFNNDINNLMVFKTKSDHTAFHMGSNIELDGDVYIAINKKTMKINKSQRLKAKVSGKSGAYKTVKWTSSNNKYATVTSKGQVKALKAGKGKTVTITASALDGSGKKARFKIKLK